MVQKYCNIPVQQAQVSNNYKTQCQEANTDDSVIFQHQHGQ